MVIYMKSISFLLTVLLLGLGICYAQDNTAQEEQKLEKYLEKYEQKISSESLPQYWYLKDPKPSYNLFYELLTTIKEQKDLLVLVDKKHALSKDYTPAQLEEIKTPYDTRTFKLTSQTVDALKRLMADAKKEGLNIYPVSAYRTFQYQKRLYDNSVKKNGQEHANKYSALPGHSQHHLGTAVDFNDVEVRFENTKEFAWLKNNAGKYGFSLSFPKGQEDITGYAYEPWHFRYIGNEAVIMQDIFFEGSQQKMLEFLDKHVFTEK